MTDTTPASVESGAAPPTKSRRGRRVLGLILAVLILLLGLASYLLFRLVSVPGTAIVMRRKSFTLYACRAITIGP